MVLRFCLIDLRNCTAWSRDTRTGTEILIPSGRLENVFSGRQLGFVEEETLVVFHTRMPRETARQRGNEMENARKSRLETSTLFSTESEETDLRERLKRSKGQSCD